MKVGAVVDLIGSVVTRLLDLRDSLEHIVTNRLARMGNLSLLVLTNEATPFAGNETRHGLALGVGFA